MRKTALALLVAAQAAAGAADSTPRAAISRALADSCARKLDDLAAYKPVKGKEARSRTAPSVTMTEGEINSYVNITLKPDLPPGVTDVAVQLDRDRIHATAEVDIAEVRKHVKDMSRWNPLSMISGSVPVRLSGRYLTAEEGFGRVEIEEAQAAGIPIPISLLEQMIVGATKSSSKPGGFDIHAPFRLPHPVRRVRLMPGQALLDL